MSDISYETEVGARSLEAEPRDYVQLLKPRVMSLVLFTALAGFLLADRLPHPILAFASLLSIAVGAGASGALNMWYDADIDSLMSRTRTRPVPDGRLAPGEALGFGIVLSVLSVMTLGLAANWLAAALLAFTIFFYVVVYTMWLKRSTPLNIVIGGAAGALPPVVGYAAATGDVNLASIALFTIIFMWTPPHFWALALLKKDDYGRARVPMLPNARGDARTRLEILIYSILLAPIGVLPWLMGFASIYYGVASVVLGAVFIAAAAGLYRERRADRERRVAGQLFGYSIAYLFLLFLMIVIERLVHFVYA